MRKTHIFIIYNNSEDIERAYNNLSLGLVGNKYEFYFVKNKEIFKVFRKIDTLDDNDYVWITSNNVDISYTGKLDTDWFDTDAICLEPGFTREFILPSKEYLKSYDIRPYYSSYIVKAKFLKGVTYRTHSDIGILDNVYSAILNSDNVYVCCSTIISGDNIIDRDNVKEDILFIKNKEVKNIIYNNALDIFSDSLPPLSLSIVILICDKDAKYLPGLVKNIKKNISSIKYEIVVLDNRDDISLNLEPLIGENKIKYVRLGGNKYQYYARAVAPKFVENEYIWFVDADDEILKVDETTVKGITQADIIAFNAKADDGTEIVYENTGVLDIRNTPTAESLYKLCKTQVWNHWYRGSVLYRAMKSLPERNIICNDDVILTLAMLKKANNIFYAGKSIYKWNKSLGTSCSDTMTVDAYKNLLVGVADSFDVINVLESNNTLKRTIYLNTLRWLLSRLNKIEDLEEWYEAYKLFLLNFPIKPSDEEAIATINSSVAGIDKKKLLWPELLKKLSLGDSKYARDYQYRVHKN